MEEKTLTSITLTFENCDTIDISPKQAFVSLNKIYQNLFFSEDMLFPHISSEADSALIVLSPETQTLVTDFNKGDNIDKPFDLFKFIIKNQDLCAVTFNYSDDTKEMIYLPWIDGSHETINACQRAFINDSKGLSIEFTKE